MRGSNRIAVFLCIFCLLLPAAAGSGETITWIVADWPPLMELDDQKLKITGGQYGNQLLMLQKKLPGFVHVNREMRWNRFWYMIKKGEQVCSCLAYKNEAREKMAEFSIPISLILPNNIVMRKGTLEKLGNPASLSLIELMADKNLKGVLIENRSYSFDADKLLEIHEPDSNIERYIIDERTYIKMLGRKRMDYILEYPAVVRHTVEKSLPELRDAFSFVPIRELDPFYFVYVACPRTPWGKRLSGR